MPDHNPRTTPNPKDPNMDYDRNLPASFDADMAREPDPYAELEPDALDAAWDQWSRTHASWADTLTVVGDELADPFDRALAWLDRNQGLLIGLAVGALLGALLALGSPLAELIHS